MTSAPPARAHTPVAAICSLRANFTWTFLGNLVYAGSQWGLLVVLTRLADPEVVGEFALAFAVTAPVFMLTNLQLRAVQCTDARGDFLFSDYLALRLATIGLALVLVAAVAVATRPGPEALGALCIVAAAKSFESVSDVFYGLLQQHEKMDRIAVSMMIKGALSLVLFGLALAATRSLVWALAAMTLGWAAVLVGYDLRSGSLIMRLARRSFEPNAALDLPRTSLRPRWRWDSVRVLAVLSLPMGVVMMLVSLNTNIPRYVIEHFVGTRDLGVFAAVTALLVAGTTVVNALGQSASPRLAKYYAARDRVAFGALTWKLMLTGLGLGGAGVAVAGLAGRQILAALYGSAYSGYSNLLMWVAAAAGVSYLQSFAGYAVTSARCFGIQAPLVAMVTLVTTAGCVVLVPQFGAVGAAAAMGLAAVVHLAGNAAITRRALCDIAEPQRGER